MADTGNQPRGAAGITRSAASWLVLATGIAAGGIVWLSASLPPEGFFAGDSGLKLIAALNAIEHPSRPFEVSLPSIAGEPVPYVEPMIAVHDGHGHVLQSPLFPALSAPLVAAFGLRGAYILPALAFVALVPLLEVLRRYGAPHASFPLLAWIAVTGNPVMFYALEYWEHAPAVALAAGSAAAALVGLSRPNGANWIVSSGALAALSVVMRPEALWCLAGLGIIVGRTRWLQLGFGAAAILVPFAAANYAHSGTVIGLHAAAALAPLETAYLATRWEWMQVWLWPHGPAAAVGIALVASAWIAAAFRVEMRLRQAVGLLGVVVIAILATRRLLPRESIWQAFPLASLALIPAAGLDRHARHLFVLALATAIGVVLTAAHDGGAQWGPRFLLITLPPLLVLAARAGTDALGPGRLRAARAGLVIVALLAGVATSRAAYLDLRGAKRTYARIVAATAAATSPGDVILTNVWWLDQVAASLHGRRTFLFAAGPEIASEAAARLELAGVPHVVLISTDEDGGETLDAALDATCYKLVSIRRIPDRDLRVASAGCTHGGSIGNERTP